MSQNLIGGEPKKATPTKPRFQDCSRSGLIFRVLGYSSATITVLAYFFGPLPDLFPFPWGTITAIVGFFLLLLAVVVSSLHATRAYMESLKEVIVAQVNKSIQRFDTSQKKNRKQLSASFNETKESILSTINEAIEDQAGLEGLVNSLQELSDISHSLCSASTLVANSKNPQIECRRHLTAALERFARIYAQLTGHKVRACIKMICTESGRQGRRVAVTLARSSSRVSDSPDAIHFIDANTDFSAISSGQAYWFSDDIEKELDYNNTSTNRPYRSVIVWGIRNAATGGAAEALIGFLCLDTESIYAFDRKRDVFLGWWMVDAVRSLYQAAGAEGFKVFAPDFS